MSLKCLILVNLFISLYESKAQDSSEFKLRKFGLDVGIGISPRILLVNSGTHLMCATNINYTPFHFKKRHYLDVDFSNVLTTESIRERVGSSGAFLETTTYSYLTSGLGLSLKSIFHFKNNNKIKLFTNIGCLLSYTSYVASKTVLHDYYAPFSFVSSQSNEYTREFYADAQVSPFLRIGILKDFKKFQGVLFCTFVFLTTHSTGGVPYNYRENNYKTLNIGIKI